MKMIDNALKCCGKNVYRNNLHGISFFIIFWLQIETTYQKANNVVKQFLTEHLSDLNHLKHCLTEHAKVIQYLYATLFPKYYSRKNKFGIQNKSLGDLAYKE